MSPVTHQSSQGNRVSAGPASDVKTFVAAAMLTFTAGVVVLIGYLMAGGFGGFMGIIGAVFGVVWWKGVHGKVFPKDLPSVSLMLLGVVGLLLVGLVYGMS